MWKGGYAHWDVPTIGSMMSLEWCQAYLVQVEPVTRVEARRGVGQLDAVVKGKHLLLCWPCGAQYILLTSVVRSAAQ